MQVHHTFFADLLPLWLSKVHLFQAKVKEQNFNTTYKLTRINRGARDWNNGEIQEPLQHQIPKDKGKEHCKSLIHIIITQENRKKKLKSTTEVLDIVSLFCKAPAMKTAQCKPVFSHKSLSLFNKSHTLLDIPCFSFFRRLVYKLGKPIYLVGFTRSQPFPT